MIKVGFHGAASTVTGSNFLVKTDNATFVVDCGMFQGKDVEARNLLPYEYEASEVDFVLLTHAHIDHSGMLPKLYKQGFRGPIYSTNNTIQISSLLLLDSAKIQEGNFQKGETYGKYTDKVGLAYSTEDANQTIALFKTIDFKDEFRPAEGIKIRFIRAGHILGAASIEVTVNDNGTEKVLLFSGDLGRVEQPLIESYDKTYHANPDYIFIESLYGGVEHPARKDSVQELIKITNETIAKNGSVFIPSFAVQRTQELLHDFKIAYENNQIPEDVQVWLDSPLAQRVSHIYTAALQDTPDSLFHFDQLKYVQKYRQSQKLSTKNRQIIIAGSGMADGGRIVDHLSYALTNRKNSIVFVGFQAEGTLGRQLVEGAKSVQIGKTNVKVEANVYHLQGFSAHGDTSDYLEWIERFKSEKLKQTFLIHAEEDRALALKGRLNEIGFNNLTIPEWKQEVELN